LSTKYEDEDEELHDQGIQAIFTGSEKPYGVSIEVKNESQVVKAPI
jgi:hypothetical protein